ncbi:MAG: di-heme oxidoredictase family protein, partial [Pseudomonadota bacterium]
MLRHTTIVLTLFVGILSFPLDAAADLTDLHLPVIPRTEAEKERIAAVIRPTTDFSKPEQFESNPAGAATVRVIDNRNAFSLPSGNISFEKELDFKVGNGLFKKLWVSSPSSTLASDGLGPLFNARSCQRCHLKDGRGHPPERPDDSATSMLMRVSIAGGATPDEIEGYIASQPEPSYGGQIQDFSIAGVPAEAQIKVAYTEEVIQLSGGETASLRTPHYDLTNLGYGPLHPDAMISPRVAPQMIGLGLLDAIPAADILALADPDDADGDGISGRAQIVVSTEYGVPMLGRFGLKAGKPSVWEQTPLPIAPTQRACPPS